MRISIDINHPSNVLSYRDLNRLLARSIETFQCEISGEIKRSGEIPIVVGDRGEIFDSTEGADKGVVIGSWNVTE